ncbi:DUF885 domain-containing protein [Derxia lacustris]|uniref:DUF885 domain-containing protein n=1 Tax=Derxia lacustris TaxID=764842 RepID=UPI000A16EA37|nr:DUF885 domain-containing protein [Derxia lacustris]
MTASRAFAGWLLAGALLPAPAFCAAASMAADAGMTAQAMPATPEASALAGIAADYWDAQLREDPFYASSLGDHRFDDRVPDASPAGVARRRAFAAGLRQRLAALDRAALAPADRISVDVLDTELGRRARLDAHFAGLPFGPDGLDDWMPFKPMEGPQFDLAQLALATDLPDAAAARRYIARLAGLPGWLGQLRDRMSAARRAGWMPPAVAMTEVPAQFDRHLGADLDALPLFEPFTRLPASLPPAERDALRADARRVLASAVVPALRSTQTFLRRDYLPHASQRSGASALPGGARYYADLIALETTTDFAPEAIRDLGLAEVARIDAAMNAVQARLGFAGSRADFVTWLRARPDQHYATADELLAGYRDLAKRIDAALPKLFAELPRLPFGIRAMDPSEGDNAEHYTEGSADAGRAGFFEVNANNLDRRPRYDMEALLLHEAAPGHHTQIARAQELTQLPEFRRHAWFGAYGEGWALYAESLGEELGLYTDPASRFGRLSAEMFRACRLVVDTGLHAFGWTREQAADYLVANAAIDRDVALAEVDRYLTWPAQALDYKLGEITIQRLRARASAELGPKFDVRRFHGAVLDEGALPLAVLERRVGAWIEAERAR